MTPDQWNASTADPIRMLDFVRASGAANDRRMRLLLCASCRYFRHHFQATNGHAVVVAEHLADGRAVSKEVQALRRALADQLLEVMGWREEDLAVMLDRYEGVHFEDSYADRATVVPLITAARLVAVRFPAPKVGQTLDMLASTFRTKKSWQEWRGWLCQFVRDLFGNPFREVHLAPSLLTWSNGTVVKLAEAAYMEREMPSGELDRAKLGVLADALEESGCVEGELLDHLRGRGPCVRGCWVIDLLLNKA